MEKFKTIVFFFRVTHYHLCLYWKSKCFIENALFFHGLLTASSLPFGKVNYYNEVTKDALYHLYCIKAVSYTHLDVYKRQVKKYHDRGRSRRTCFPKQA